MIYYFGGKFNPPTKGHLSVLEGLINYLISDNGPWNPSRPAGDRIVIGVKTGDFPGSEGIQVCSSDEYRLKLMYEAINDLAGNYPNVKGFKDAFIVAPQNIDRTWAYFQSQPAWWPEDGKVTIVMGEDEWKAFDESVVAETNGADPTSGKWHHAQDIYQNYKTFRVDRDSMISSTRVREIFRANPFVNYSDISDYLTKGVFDAIVQQQLYWQMGREEDARREENLFLREYDMTKFPRPSCTATMLMVASDVGSSKVLLVRRGGHPYKGFWSLPGGFFEVDKDESLEDTAQRELCEETDWSMPFFPHDQFRTYSGMGIDPRGRVVDHVYAKTVSKPVESIFANDDADEVAWWPIDKLPRMAFHHRQVIEDWARENICKEKH